MAAGVVSVGLVGALAVTGPTNTFQAIQDAANTLIVVGGNSDPTSGVEWGRIFGGTPPGLDLKLVNYAADVGIGIPGLPPLSFAGKDTYSGSVDEGSAKTIDYIEAGRANGGTVDVYALSLGTDVVGVALLKLAPKTATEGNVNVVQHGGPSFINSGIWYMAPPLIPGLRTGPVATQPLPDGVTVTNICIKGDSICGMGTNPITAAFYFLPGFDLHGKDYTFWQIGKYSPADNEILYTPGAASITKAEVAGPSTTEKRNGQDMIVQKYKDGTVTRTWEEDGQTWVVIDTGVNPWVRLLDEYKIPLPAEVRGTLNTVLNTLMPVPEPGEKGLLSFPMGLWQGAGAFVEKTVGDAADSLNPFDTFTAPAPVAVDDSTDSDTSTLRTFSAASDVDDEVTAAELAAKEQAAKEQAAREQAARELAAKDAAESREEIVPEPPAADPDEALTPETITPETITPETITPETITPETTTPETTTPEVVVPEATKPTETTETTETTGPTESTELTEEEPSAA